MDYGILPTDGIGAPFPSNVANPRSRALSDGLFNSSAPSSRSEMLMYTRKLQPTRAALRYEVLTQTTIALELSDP